MVEPRQIIEESDSELSIKWSDEVETEYNASQLRKACPCASCVNEWTGERILKTDAITDNLSFAYVTVVGRYALNFHFSDGHDTGIFSFKYLRELAHKT